MSEDEERARRCPNHADTYIKTNDGSTGPIYCSACVPDRLEALAQPVVEEKERFTTFYRIMGTAQAPKDLPDLVAYACELESIVIAAKNRADNWRFIANEMGYEPNAHKHPPLNKWLSERIAKFKAAAAQSASPSPVANCSVGSCQRHGKCMYLNHPQCPLAPEPTSLQNPQTSAPVVGDEGRREQVAQIAADYMWKAAGNRFLYDQRVWAGLADAILSSTPVMSVSGDEGLRKSAEMAAMYGHEVQTKDLDAAYELRDALAALSTHVTEAAQEREAGWMPSEYEVWQKDAFGDGESMVAGSDSLADAQHYAAVYSQDAPTWVVEVRRRPLPAPPRIDRSGLAQEVEDA